MPDSEAGLPASSLALVTNPKSGALLAGNAPGGSIAGLFEQAGLTANEIADGRPLPDRIAEALKTGARTVVVAGGDGTIACAAQALAGSGVALGIIPCGTMNLLAKDLKLPVGDPAGAVAVLAQGLTRAIDVGDADGQLFLCASMLGTPARLSRIREAGREKGGGVLAWARLAGATWRAFSRGRTPKWRLRIDGGKTIRIRSAAITITVNALDDAAGHAFGRSRLDGGELVIYVLRKSSILGLLRLLAKTLLRRDAARDSAVTVLRAKEIVIHGQGETIRVLLDGEERLLPTPLHYSIRPRALQVVAPCR